MKSYNEVTGLCDDTESFRSSLWLLTPEEFEQLPKGTQVRSVNGLYYLKGIDPVDDDTRAGYLAYGIENPLDHPLRDQLLLMILNQ